MDNDTTNDLMKAAVLAFVRHGIGWTGVWLVTHGALTQGDETQYVQIGSGIAIAAISYLWSVYQKKGVLGMLNDLKSAQKHLLSVPMLPVASPQAPQINAAIAAARKAAGFAPLSPPPSGPVVTQTGQAPSAQP